MGPWTLVLILGIGLGASHPATKLEPVQGDGAKVQVGSSRTDLVELTLPLKITNKEELITWVTYAMRLMASRINITLADVENKMAPEKVEKLKNSTAVISKLIDKMSGDMKKKPDGAKTVKSVMASFKKEDRPKKQTPAPDCDNSEKEPENSKSPEAFASTDTQSKFGLLPLTHGQFSKTNAVPSSFNTFGKFVNELALVNPYEHPDELFRDSGIFPRFDLNQKPAKTYLPLPLNPDFTADKLKNFYTLMGEPMQQRINGRPEPLVQVVPLRGAASTVNKPTMAEAPKDPVIFAKPVTLQPPTTQRSVIAVPFEAFITITRETEATTSKDCDQNEASTSGVSDIEEPVKKEMDSRKSTVVFEDQTTTVKSTDKKKKKKTPSSSMKKRQPNLLQTLIKAFISNNTSTYSPFSNALTRLTKKLAPKMKQNKGKRNETSQKQIEDDDDGRFGSDDNLNNNNNNAGEDDFNDTNNNNNNDDNDGGVVNSAPNDDFDDFDDDFNNNQNDYDDYGGGGSLGSLEDLLPLVIPILEDISDPESDTDLGEFLQASIPLIMGLSDPDPETGEAPDFIGVLGPILQNLLLGRDGQGSDAGAILGPLVQLGAPFIGPLLGPLIGPLSSSLSGGEGGSTLSALLSAVITPLLKPTEYGGKSPLAMLTASIVPIVLKELSSPEIDIGGLTSQVVAGTLSGLSGAKKGHAPAYGPAYDNKVTRVQPQALGLKPPPKRQQQVTFRPPRQQQRPASQKKKKTTRLNTKVTEYRPQATHLDTQPQVPVYNYEQVAAPAGYGTYGAPANSVDPFELLGSAFKDILGGSVNLFSSFLGASASLSGASSSSSSDSNHKGEGGGGYGPPPVYGAPPASYYNKPGVMDSYQNFH